MIACQYLVVCVRGELHHRTHIVENDNFQKMENIRQTFTDASSLLSKAVKVAIDN